MKRICTLALLFLYFWPIFPVFAVPTKIVNGVPLPDFSKITFRQLPALQAGGQVIITDPTILATLGYDPSRTWFAGDLADGVLMLGDVSKAFGLEQFSLQTIAELTGTVDLNQLLLSDLNILSDNTVADIVQSLDYGDLSPEQVPLLGDLAAPYLGDANSDGTLGGLVNAVPEFGQLSLSTADLSRYGLGGLPGLESLAIGKLSGWASQRIQEIPGLRDVPFGSFALFSNAITGFTKFVDIPLKSVEQNRTRTITGSDIEGFAVPCTNSCLHIELSDGKQWIGKTQMVRGGHGTLATVNGGKEPTGRLPYGNWGKVVLTDVDEKKGTAGFGLYFRFCLSTLFADFGCTPYFLGPIPWLPTQEKALTFIGF
jgi:hypothetical protein